MTLTQSPTAFGSVAELRMRISALECAGAELAREAERWKARCRMVETERDELATLVELADLDGDAQETLVDQSAELRQARREVGVLENVVKRYESSLAAALGEFSGNALDAAVRAIREAKRWRLYPKRYHP